MMPTSTVILIAMACLIIGAFFGMLALALCRVSGNCQEEDEPMGYEAGVPPKVEPTP